MTCDNCIKQDVCLHDGFTGEKGNPYKCEHFKDKYRFAEVKHGKWIIRDDSKKFYYYDGTVSYEDCGCSRCGKWGYSDMKYCPHCGTRMDGDLK